MTRENTLRNLHENAPAPAPAPATDETEPGAGETDEPTDEAEAGEAAEVVPHPRARRKP